MSPQPIARMTFDPTTTFRMGGETAIPRQPSELVRRAVATIRGFYSDRLAWAALLITAVVLTYIGGAAMFWYHAIYLGEGGPAISNWLHWLIDSTAGALGLTPAVALILPLAAWVSMAEGKVRRGIFVLLGGLAFAVVTLPGPFVHNILVGRGTWIASKVTQMWGDGSAHIPTATPVSVPVELGRQFAFGLPLYIALMAGAVVLIRGLVAIRHRAAAGPATA
ncbi:hypothetical protein J5X84_42745 [Streptosporangiaceae bacterium NEAU-GS5]|nr:hypothetical protein [Streptosporangiaceae bacterium NEAU-GS5]